jgi:hypothetical protein
MAAGRLPTDQVFNVANAGPGISIGKSTEIYGTSIQVESEVLKALSQRSNSGYSEIIDGNSD